jgi:hypothetical protein
MPTTFFSDFCNTTLEKSVSSSLPESKEWLRCAKIVQYLGEIKLARGRMTLPVIHSLWQSSTRNSNLDGLNAAPGLAISGILTFSGGDEQSSTVFAS